MKNFLIFCGGSFILYQITRYNRNYNNKKNKKIDGIIFGETGVNFAYQLGIK